MVEAMMMMMMVIWYRYLSPYTTAQFFPYPAGSMCYYNINDTDSY